MTLMMAWRGAEAYNENGAALDGERDIARDLVELLLERYDRVQSGHSGAQKEDRKWISNAP